MTRVRTDNVFGTTTDNPLTAGATTMNSAGLANLAAVSSAEAIIILDRNRVAGAPEIVVVTAHTASATSATIQRGQFGTTARQHAAGTEWVHGPIASNATSYATAADDQGDYVPMNGWEAYTPTLTQSATVTKTVTTARYLRVGRMITVAVKLVVTGAGTAANPVLVGLPVAALSANGIAGPGHIIDASTGTRYVLFVLGNSTTTAAFVHDTSGTNFFGVGPGVTLAVNDEINLSLTYEAAS